MMLRPIPSPCQREKAHDSIFPVWRGCIECR